MTHISCQQVTTVQSGFRVLHTGLTFGFRFAGLYIIICVNVVFGDGKYQNKLLTSVKANVTLKYNPRFTLNW